MDLFIRPTLHAEDLPYSRLILGVHVIHRGFDAWSLIGVGSALGVSGFKAIQSRAKGNPSSIPTMSSPLLSRIVRYSSRTGLFGLAFGAIFLTGVMYNKSLIEWQDRSWRLLHNSGQNQTDHWSFAGATLGAITGYAYSQNDKKQIISKLGNIKTSRIILGGASTGATIAMVSMLALNVLLKSGTKVKLVE